MIKILSDILVLKNASMEKDKVNKTFLINLSFRNLDGKIINQTLNYHNYDEAIDDFMILSKSIKNN